MNKLYSFLGLMLVLCFAGNQSSVNGQTFQTSSKNLSIEAPIAVSEVFLKDGVSFKDTKKSTDNIWLDSLQIKAKNVSGKNIKFLEVKVVLSSDKLKNGSIVLPFQYGYSNSDNFEADGLKAVRPNTAIDLNVSKSPCYGKREVIAESGYVPESLGEIETRIGTIIFEDGTAWADGVLYDPDPNNPNAWLLPDKKSKWSVLNTNYLGDLNQISFTSAALKVSSKSFSCGVYTGFQILYDCCPDILVFSNTVDFNQSGKVTLAPVQDTCPDGTLSCIFYEAVPCT